jgi:predicted N-acetyltransferase YhbS
MTTNYTLRPAQRSDCNAIAALLGELNRAEGYDGVSDAASIAAALFDANTPAPLFALVAQSGEGVVGVLLYYTGYDTLSASYGYHLADMIVTKAHRASGIGRALVKALAAQTLHEGKEWVSLTALKRNVAAREFYLALGMTQVDVDFFAMGKHALAQL